MALLKSTRHANFHFGNIKRTDPSNYHGKLALSLYESHDKQKIKSQM